MIRFGGAKIDEWRKLVYVQEILDATRFVGVWRGQTYECRAAPSTSPLTVGDTVVCHVMPGSSELITVTRETGMMFIGGFILRSPNRGHLYRWDGVTAAPVLAWEQAAAESFSALGVVGSYLYIAGYNYDTDVNSLYRWPVADANRADWAADPTNVPTLLGAYAAPVDPVNNPSGYSDAANQMAWWGNKLYIHHSSYWQGNSYLACYDPATGNITTVATETDFSDGSGGLCVSGDRLYWSSNNILHSSADGALWAIEEDPRLRADNRFCCMGFVTDPVNDVGYFTWQEGPAVPGPTDDIEIVQLDNTGFPATLTVVANGDLNVDPRWTNQTIRWVGATPSKIYSVSSPGGILWEGDAAVPAGSFAAVTADLGRPVSPCNQSCLPWQNRIYWLILEYDRGLWTVDVTLRYYDPATAATGQAIAFPTADLDSEMNYMYGPHPLAITGGSRQVQEL